MLRVDIVDIENEETLVLTNEEDDIATIINLTYEIKYIKGTETAVYMDEKVVRIECKESIVAQIVYYWLLGSHVYTMAIEEEEE